MTYMACGVEWSGVVFITVNSTFACAWVEVMVTGKARRTGIPPHNPLGQARSPVSAPDGHPPEAIVHVTYITIILQDKSGNYKSG